MSGTLEQVPPRSPLIPIPVVVDACVLLRNVGYTLRKRYAGALLACASGDYTLTSGVVLYATTTVLEEVERNLARVARNAGAPEAAAIAVWNEMFLPRLRIVELDDTLVDDPRVAAVRALHADDAPTAALAVELAPCVLLTDNRKHFAPLGLPDRPVDEIAVDIHKVSELFIGTNGVMLIGGLTGTGIAGGAKKIYSTLGKEGALLVALLLAGAAYLYWRSEPGSRFRRGVATAVRDFGPVLLEAVAERMALSEAISALAIEPQDGTPSAFRYVAQRLTSGPTTMTTTEIAAHLRGAGYRCTGEGDHRVQVRAWLERSPCFFELRRGHWTLGYHAVPALATPAAEAA